MAHDITISSSEGNLLIIRFNTPENTDSLQFAADQFARVGIPRWENEAAPANITTFTIHEADLSKMELMDPVRLAHSFVIYANLESVILTWIPYIDAFNQAFNVEVDHNGAIDGTRMTPSFS
jgi:hypothetical protein